MKLIDLLVQELPKRGGWPCGVEKIAQDYDGQIRLDGEMGFVFNRVCDNCRPRLKPLSNCDSYYFVTREQYEAALSESQQPAWNGEGLPPVGTICEALSPVGMGEPWSWQRVKVVESGIEGAEKECLVYNLETTAPSWVDELRPIRTEAEKNNKYQYESMHEVAKPVIKWINDHANPHSVIIIDATSAVLYSGEKSINTEEFIKD